MIDHEAREFRSPFASYASDQPAVKPPKPEVVTIPGLDRPRALDIAFGELRKLPVARQNLLIGHLMALLRMHPADSARVALHAQPYLTDAEVAVLCGKSERQLRRYAEYQKFKAGFNEEEGRLKRSSIYEHEFAD